jgi:cell wall-active antibiotic response 4TMS protein YvqF
MRSKSALAPLILIALGTLFLLSNLGLLPHLGPLFARWWPVSLIAVGGFLLVRKT